MQSLRDRPVGLSGTGEMLCCTRTSLLGLSQRPLDLLLFADSGVMASA